MTIDPADLVREQPTPTPSDARPSWEAVIEKCRKHVFADYCPDWQAMIRDMEARNAEGIRKYGMPLCPHNGRDSLVDCYQELLDAAVYAENASAEIGGDRLEALARGIVFYCGEFRKEISRREREGAR